MSRVRTTWYEHPRLLAFQRRTERLGERLTFYRGTPSERAYRYVWACFFTGLWALLNLLLFPLTRKTVRRFAGWQVAQSHVAAFFLARRNEPLPPVTEDRGRLRRWLAFHASVGTLIGAFGTIGWGYVLVSSISLAMWSLDSENGSPPALARLIFGDVPTTGQTGLLTAIGAGIALALPALLGPPLARFHATKTLALLGPTREDVLTATRSNALDAHSAELRRIERDLHDGTQAQLVALSLRLGIAEQKLAEDPDAVAQLLKDARGGAEDAMTELRGVIRTMYPPILADRGLAGAISGLAARSVIPVAVTMDDVGSLPAPVEAAAYFLVAEALTNAAKHSAATQIVVQVDRDSRGLHVQVTDDGVGGVDATQGTGIVGIERRVAALDGMTTVDSPIGGGTTITVEIPCGS